MALLIQPGDRIKVTASIINTGLNYTYKFGCSIGLSNPQGTSKWHPHTGGPVQYDDGLGEYIDVPLVTGQTANVSRIFKISDDIPMSQFAELLDTWVTVKDQSLVTLSEDIDMDVLEPIFPGATITFVSVQKV